MKVRNKSFHEGARLERTAIAAHVRRMVKRVELGEFDADTAMQKTLEYIAKRVMQYRRKKGGL